MASSVNCSLLATRTDFNAYAKKLINATNGDLKLLSLCKVEVCGALWGYGNSDISGIGMIVGYILEHAFGSILAVMVLSTASSSSSRIAHTFKQCLTVFHNYATIFAFSFEIAATVVLAREDYGINASGMGDNTVRITQSAAMLVLLPLLYAIMLLESGTSRIGSTDGLMHCAREGKAEPKPEEQSSKQFTVFAICWALAFYPFYSKMNAAFGPSKISHHGKSSVDSVLTSQQFATIQDVCFDPLRAITTTEDHLMTAFVMLAYIPLSVYVIGRIVSQIVEDRHTQSTVHKFFLSLRNTGKLGKKLILLALVAIPLLGSALLWSIFHVKHFQEQLAAGIGLGDPDSYWTFGQVMAVTVFTPVLVEGWNAYKSESSIEQIKIVAEKEVRRVSPWKNTQTSE